jgi:hypothetical protein
MRAGKGVSLRLRLRKRQALFDAAEAELFHDRREKNLVVGVLKDQAKAGRGECLSLCVVHCDLPPGFWTQEALE